MPLLKLHGNDLSPALEEPLHEVTLDDWRENPTAHTDATALVLPNAQSLSDIKCDLNGFSVVILEFPTFKDGRAYSQARLLRQRYGYTGEIRARGNVLRDQLWFMARCGVNAFEFSAENANDAKTALQEFSYAYQSCADKRAPVWRRRFDRSVAA
ncbi:MAG: hypothetical protein DHS20C05_21910 [Hyphococcus sp.]|nr:MAG: hypothetical protein DHS20C05_21910 [Marinicaulis sp.]